MIASPALRRRHGQGDGDVTAERLLKTHCHTGSYDPELYDLLCNTGRLSVRTTAELIVAVLRKRVD